MADNTKAIANDLEKLVKAGYALLFEEAKHLKEEKEEGEEKRSKGSKASAKASRKSKKQEPAEKYGANPTFGSQYQLWYSQALRVIEQVLPNRYEEFQGLYRLEKQASDLNASTYRINDYLQGTRVTKGGIEVFDAAGHALVQFMLQVDILASASDQIGSVLSDIRGTLEATLLDDELATAEGLLKAKHVRSAGVVAGVVLERHLKRTVENHEVTFRKTPQIGSLNDALKEAKVIDVPQWRFIQRLGDIRNLCGHDKERDPVIEEVEDLIRGTEKVVATVF